MKIRNKFSGMGFQYNLSPIRAANPAQGDLGIRAIEGWVGFEAQIFHSVALSQVHFSKEWLTDKHCFGYFVTVQPRKRKYESEKVV